MDELVKWLGEQLDEDGRANASPYEWNAWHALDCDQLPDGDRVTYPCTCGVPARMLREVEAKREALAHYERIQQHTRQGGDAYVLAEGAVSKQIQIMATAYADRPGYREEWRPS